MAAAKKVPQQPVLVAAPIGSVQYELVSYKGVTAIKSNVLDSGRNRQLLEARRDELQAAALDAGLTLSQLRYGLRPE